jgi:hypothetical protein
MAAALSGITRKISTAWKSAKGYVRTFRKGQGTERDSITDPNAKSAQRSSTETIISMEESRLCHSMERSLGFGADYALDSPTGMKRNESLQRLPVPRQTAPRVRNTIDTVPERDDEDSPSAD